MQLERSTGAGMRLMPAAVALLIVVTASQAWADFKAGLEAYLRGDYATALTEFRPLAQQGHAKAQFGLGLIYSKGGRGVPQDYAEAVRWYHRAAEQGHAGAQYNLGRMYRKGRGDGSFCKPYSLESGDVQQFKFPTTLTFVQQAYLSELCLVVSERVADSQRKEGELRTAAIFPKSSEEEEEFEVEKALLEIERQHLENLTTLLENSIRTEPFSEEAFWEAWLNERERYYKVSGPLIQQQLRLLLERIEREGGTPGESRKPDE